MDQRISFVTLAVADIDVTRRFYVDGLGWTPELDVPGEVIMFRAGEHLVLSLWERSHFEAEVGALMTGHGVAPITIAHNLATPEAVDAVLSTARAAGSPHVEEAVRRDWGGYTGLLEDGTPRFVHGYSGYFSDPDGYRWEIAYNPDPKLGAIVLPD
ncbi:hypothetical protein BJ993_000568 [Nocardioides aromaticivorans]|uniref:VOC domain-containing protein n=1 Tax=Nocardioides aromaticivorans TaxID=200618 RepID=A0A7Y9ZFA9_9ACTN|nr:VOC family protein [Nocardioides aromaticivorans]NYI43488.1 hypothetical protein [Nocardioides aromaticivorans]